MNTQQLYFVAPGQVEIRQQQLNPLQQNEILLKSLYSGISAGTEMLVYRGQLPDGMVLDESLAAFATQKIQYPLQYGYASVAVVEKIGRDVDTSWLGQKVFSFQPHGSHHICTTDAVIPLPNTIDAKEAVFLANMETAVNLVQDGKPGLGDRVVVLGQGIVGLLVSGILVRFPLAGLYGVESLNSRRELSIHAGVHESFTPTSDGDIAALKQKLELNGSGGGADVVFEITGAPTALNLAVDLCAYSGRIVIGSWYGSKRAEINLGERFHRNRLSIVSSQVSTIAPELAGRWDKTRRFAVAWDMIEKSQPAQYISHCVPFAEAASAYRLLDETPQGATQVVFDYQGK